MQTQFIRGFAVTALIGTEQWQKTVEQKLKIDLDWQEVNKNSDVNASKTPPLAIGTLATQITAKITEKHWESLAVLAEHIKQFLQQQQQINSFKLKITVPFALPNVEATGVYVEHKINDN